MSCRETFLSMALNEGGASLLPPESARGCVETLTLMPGHVLRDVNGDVWRTHFHSYQRYCLHIMGKDRYSIALEGLQVGTKLWIECASYLTASSPDGSEEMVLERDPVPQSVLFRHAGGQIVSLHSVEGRRIRLPQNPLKGFVMYRPALVMVLKQFILKTDEWGGSVSWSLDLEEI